MKDRTEKGYFDVNNYNPDKHWHIDTWVDENTPYFEAVAFERLDNNSWDVFFNEFEDESEIYNICGDNIYIIEPFGVFLFNSLESEVESKFRNWVNSRLLSYRREKL